MSKTLEQRKPFPYALSTILDNIRREGDTIRVQLKGKSTLYHIHGGEIFMETRVLLARKCPLKNQGIRSHLSAIDNSILFATT
jgi:hypothetical protein